MVDRPIIFSGPMVNALLAGRKSQTRRIIKNVPDAPPARCAPRNTPKHPAPYLDAYCGDRPTSTNPRGMGRNWHWWQIDDRPGPVAFRLPYATGDRLWVREAWRPHYLGDGVWDLDVSYPADGERRRIKDGEFGDRDWNWPKAADRGNVTPLHMPRWASRLTLTVTEVRVQRLQEISEADAVAEGVPHVYEGNIGDEPYCPKCEGRGVHGAFGYGYGVTEVDCSECVTARQKFRNLWNSLHGSGAWDANPWVAAYSFTVQRGNIDGPKETPND